VEGFFVIFVQEVNSTTYKRLDETNCQKHGEKKINIY